MGPFPKLNPEFVLRERPDLVMGPRREADDMPTRPGWASLPALPLGVGLALLLLPLERLAGYPIPPWTVAPLLAGAAGGSRRIAAMSAAI